MKEENRGWMYLIIGGILEIFWALTLKKSHGFTELHYSLITIVLVVISFYIFSKAMMMLPSGIAYTVYTGIGAIGTIVFGVLVLHESLNWRKVCFTLLLLIGIIGLKTSEGKEAK